MPISYFHVVFTLPAEIAAVALQNKRLLYGMLFEAASRTLMEVAANPRHMGAQEIGLLAVLHTWGQNLMHHPHLHCVVSGGGLSQDGSCWIASRKHYFLPVRVLSRVFRNKFRALLQSAFQRGELEFFGELQPLADPNAFRRFLTAATDREWVVYAKRPFGDASLRTEVPGPLHASGGDLQQPSALLSRWLRDLSLQRLCQTKRTANDDAGGRRVHPAFPVARSS